MRSVARYRKLTKFFSTARLKKLPRVEIHRLILSNVLVAAGLAVLLVGVLGIFQDRHTNAAVVKQAKQAIQSAKKTGLPSPAPSTTAPATSNYQVAADHPRFLNIPKLSVHARVLSVGLTKDGSINSPGNIYDTAWYSGSALPGGPGATLIDGHISSWTSRGVFYGLNKLVPGDQIQLQRGDGQAFNYRVITVKTYAADAVDMNAALSPITPGKPGLNLISCSGDVLAGTNDFNQRIVVFAEQS